MQDRVIRLRPTSCKKKKNRDHPSRAACRQGFAAASTANLPQHLPSTPKYRGKFAVILHFNFNNDLSIVL